MESFGFKHISLLTGMPARICPPAFFDTANTAAGGGSPVFLAIGQSLLIWNSLSLYLRFKMISLQKSRLSSRVFYGWYIVAAGFFMLFFQSGARYSFGIMFKPIH